ncbi:hypothetical protein [Streptomyces sp. 150FB]|uniref:hypothetical protein n=1 Tax=Streptomyces sp. 150FB TaxID=1576605 RepID=UPI000ACF9647|nr:hypothetical protein [Streptomyces sp. 150FB]
MAHSTGRPAKKDGAGRQSPGRTRFGGALLILLSLMFAVLCYLAFAVWLPSEGAHYRDYQAAESCPARATARAREDCLSTPRLTVARTAIEDTGKTHKYEVTLKDEDPRPVVVDFEDPGPLFERLKAGDHVTATVWHRDIVVLDKSGVRQNTDEAPRDSLQLVAAYGTLAGLFAAQAMVFGAVRLVRPGSYKLFAWNPYGGWMFAIILVTGLVVGVGARFIGIPWWYVPPAVPVVAYLFTWWAGLTYPRLRRRPRGPSATAQQ